MVTRLCFETMHSASSIAPDRNRAAKLGREDLIALDRAPRSLRHVYFTLGGSDAVDSAVRFITHFYNATGRATKKQFITLERGYHGSSSVGAGLTALPAFHRHFDLPQPNQHYIASPY